MKPKETLMLLIGIALGSATIKFTGLYASWILLFLGLFLLVVYVMQLNSEKKTESPLKNI